MNTLTIHKTTYASTNYGWLEYGLECRIGNAEIHRIFSSSRIHCALDYKYPIPKDQKYCYPEFYSIGNAIYSYSFTSKQL